jgi:hypothetical protein
MNVYCFTWNDADKNRRVEMKVNYRLAEGAVRIEQITPTKVLFYDAAADEVTRAIGVHTDTGRRLLLAAYYESISRTHLKAAILAGSIVDDEDPIEPRIAV